MTTQTTTTLDQDVTATVTLAVAAKAVADNDVVLESLIVAGRRRRRWDYELRS